MQTNTVFLKLRLLPKITFIIIIIIISSQKLF